VTKGRETAGRYDCSEHADAPFVARPASLMFLRRSRGYAPDPIVLARKGRRFWDAAPT